MALKTTRMKPSKLILAACLLVGCSNCRSEGSPGTATAKQMDTDTRSRHRFELKVDRTEGGASVFVFRFPDQIGRIPQVSSISIGKVGMKTGFCALDAKNLSGELITGFWPVGVVPKNYRRHAGCDASNLSPGDYEIQLFTQRGEFRQRLHVANDGVVKVLPWEEGLVQESLGL
jgi:hypothetical protein